MTTFLQYNIMPFHSFDENTNMYLHKGTNIQELHIFFNNTAHITIYGGKYSKPLIMNCKGQRRK
jgi:hypothetical protein